MRVPVSSATASGLDHRIHLRHQADCLAQGHNYNHPRILHEYDAVHSFIRGFIRGRFLSITTLPETPYPARTAAARTIPFLSRTLLAHRSYLRVSAIFITLDFVLRYTKNAPKITLIIELDHYRIFTARGASKENSLTFSQRWQPRRIFTSEIV